MLTVRYADGRAAVTREAQCDPGVGADALRFRIGETEHVWPYAELRRADDDAGAVILKRRPDTGERLYFQPGAELELRVAAPELFSNKALGVEGVRTVGGLAAAAWSLAALFLLGVPYAAEPIAGVIPPRYREQIGDISWSQLEGIVEYCDDSDEAARILNDMAYRLMTTSNVPQRDDIWITIVDAPIPNAFALPDHSIVVTDDLIAMAEHPDEITGVIAHEIAHIEHDHIMKNIIRSVGAGIFFDVVFGGAGAGQMVAIASVNLAGLRFSRDDEADADARGLDYLEAANIDTGGLARFFDRFAEEAEAHGGEIATLLSSHPATAARAEAARARSREGRAPSLSDADWRVVQSACGGQPTAPPATPASAPAQDNPAPAAPDAPPKPDGLDSDVKD